jgi:hypothetical protein
MELVERHGQQCWSLIATFLTGRIGKQCRERWHNHLRPHIKVITTHLQKLSERQFSDHKLCSSPTFAQDLSLGLQEVVQKNCLKNLFNSFLWP